MGTNKSLSLEAFQSLIATDSTFKDKITNRSDVIDIDNGTMTIYTENINKYLEKYACKDSDDLQDTLWFNYGIFVRIVE